MTQRRKRFALAGAVLSGIMLGGLVTGAHGALAGPPEVIELPALREAPNIPVVSLSERLPSHAPAGGVAEPATAGCDKGVDFTTSIHNARVVGFQDNVICSSSDIDVYTTGSGTFAVQAGGPEAAWVLTDVTVPSNLVKHGPFVWTNSRGRQADVNTPDVKAFCQDCTVPVNRRDYIVMGLERTKVTSPCGVIIVDVTDPADLTPPIMSQFIGSDWCDTHNVFVETDSGTGDGTYIYATANNTFDLRVLDISNLGTVERDSADLSNFPGPIEVGQYRRTGTLGFDPNGNQRGRNDPDGLFDDFLVHDVTVVDGIVYASYWSAGLDILDAISLRDPDDNVFTPRTADENDITENIDPPDFASSGNPPFLMHHAFPDSSGTRVFVQDEITFGAGDEPVQMWALDDASCGGSAPCRLDGIALDADIPANPAHNLEINSLQASRLYTGWYQMGLQGWNFDSDGFTTTTTTTTSTGDFSADVFHQAQTEADDDEISGAWGVRLEELTVARESDGASVDAIFAFVSDRNFGLIVTCLGDGITADATNCSVAVPAPEEPVDSGPCHGPPGSCD